MPFQTIDLPVMIEEDGLYRTTGELVYQGKRDTFVVPPGFRTDLASVPPFLSGLVPVAGAHDRAAILHDWLCVQLAEAYCAGGSPPIAPNDVDAMFRRSLRELGVRPFRRRVFWAGVRWGARFSPARQAGWWRTAPALFAWSAIILPTIVVPAVTTGSTLLAGRLVRIVVDAVTGLPLVDRIPLFAEIAASEAERRRAVEVRAELAARRRPCRPAVSGGP